MRFRWGVDDGGLRVASQAGKHTTSFVTAPIAFLAVAALAVVLGSLIIGARETDSIALAQQRDTIEHAIEQHGDALARELRVQTVWSEAYDRTATRDVIWMRAFFGIYLDELFGYDSIYVLSGSDKFVFGFAKDRDARQAQFERIAPGLKDLIAAVRKPAEAPATYHVISTSIDLGENQFVVHRAVADVRNILGMPATVVVSTIVPDRPRASLNSSPFLLVAIEDLDARFIKQLGKTFGFADLKWFEGTAPLGTSTERIEALDGKTVATLSWTRNQPGWEFVRRVGIGLAVALVLLVALTALLMRWGNRQARRILDSEADAKHAARTDALTGLPNRVALGEALGGMVTEAKRHESPLAVLSINLDQFKEINDDFGHAVGDAVLVAVARRLEGLLKSNFMLGRPGGDEFVMLAPGIDSTAAAGLGARIVAALMAPIDIAGGTRVHVSASVGHVLAPHDGEANDDLMRRVELAVAKAKEQGGATAIAFAPEMDLELSHRRILEGALRSAVTSDAIGIVYQPIMDPSGSRVIAVEALARWTDPMLGSIPPDVFIPLAEETGLIQKIGERALRQAVADGLAWADVDVAVNVSAAQIHHGDVVAVVRDVLSTSRFPPERLEIEITESVLLADERRADAQIKGLQRLGLKVALDDFGAGYSSLMYLRKFGFDNLKIDRSFIEDIGKSSDSPVILESVIQLGLNLSMTITAEGVETPEQHRWLRNSGCHRLQGYLFSRPLTKEQLTAFLAHHDAAAAAG